MAKYVGVDWAGKGWFGAGLRADGSWECDLFPSLHSLWHTHSEATLILIDMPIGLPSVTGHRRRCDERAKQLLGPRHQSVFYTPVREAVYETNLAAAKTINEQAGYSIQNQAWSITPRIREVDEFLDTRPGARDRIRETRPEVCYRALHGAPLASRPSEEAGRQEREELLIEHHPALQAPVRTAVDTFTKPRFAPFVRDRSHILDAFVAATTARRDRSDRATLPESPPRDERDLPMEIVYPSGVQQLTLADVDVDGQ